MDVIQRNNVKICGNGFQTMFFSHGYGCDQSMWRKVTPAFKDQYRIVLFDHVGAGGSDIASFDYLKYSALDGYANDVIEIITELKLREVIFIGHSVSAMIGILPP